MFTDTGENSSTLLFLLFSVSNITHDQNKGTILKDEIDTFEEVMRHSKYGCKIFFR